MSEALATDVHAIALAADGRREANNAMGWLMYRAAQGIPPPDLEKVEKRPPTPAELKAQAHEHNVRMAAKRTAAEAREAARARAAAARDGKTPKS